MHTETICLPGDGKQLSRRMYFNLKESTRKRCRTTGRYPLKELIEAAVKTYAYTKMVAV
jgi:hypothetical protein